jgi:hypothetical protein
MKFGASIIPSAGKQNTQPSYENIHGKEKGTGEWITSPAVALGSGMLAISMFLSLLLSKFTTSLK